MGRYDRYTYVCIADRFASKYSGRCPKCRHELRGFYDLSVPRKRDDEGWRMLALRIATFDSNVQLCRCMTCRPPLGHGALNLSQYRRVIRKRQTHHQGEVPQYRPSRNP